VPSRLEGVYHPASDQLDYAHYYQVRGAFSSKKNSKQAVSIGIVPDIEMQVGDVILLCTRPLAEELEHYAQRYSPAKYMGDDWVVPFLRGFKKVVFLDRYDYAESIGFTPWVNLELIDHYPVLIEPVKSVGGEQSALVKVLIIDHDSTRGGNHSEVTDFLSDFNGLCQWDFLTGELTLQDQKKVLLDADVHYHINYSNQVRSILSPYDSILNSIYTLIEPVKYKDTLLVDDRLNDVVGKRNYARIFSNKQNIKPDFLSMLRRIKVLNTEWLEEGNPDTTRYKGINQIDQEQKLDMLLGVLGK
jgi:hypothetical protein